MIVLEPPKEESPAVEEFGEGDTREVRLQQEAPEETHTSVGPPPESGGPWSRAPLRMSSGNEPFDKERQLGIEAFRRADWDQAIHHLSIAAALKPDASDVKDHLRRARRMRKERSS